MNNVLNLVEEINVDKEIIDTLPQNNKKNKKIYKEKIEKISEKYKQYDNILLKEIEKRARKFNDIKVSEALVKSNEELLNLQRVLYLLNENDTPFEKMDLDREILNLTFYYKKDLAKVNDAINFCLKKIEETGIVLSEKDFNFNKYVSQYVLEVMKNKGLDKLNSKFEEIYWKCPKIITYIELNIRYIYSRNEKNIIRYFKNKKEVLLKNFTEEKLKESFVNAKQENIEAQKNDKYTILEKFLSGKLQTKDYEENAIKQIIKKYVNKTDMTNEEFEKVLLDLMKLLQTVREYKQYNEYKFIIDDVKNIFNSDENYKAKYKKLKKEIEKCEKKVIKLGKTGLFRKSEDDNLVKQTQELLKLKEKYKEYDLMDVSAKFKTLLNEHSTLYDVLNLACQYYKFLFKCIVEKYKDITEDQINDYIDNMEEFVRNPLFIILNNIEINEQKDIVEIIKDRYNLLNINITKEDLEVDNLDTLIEDLEKCELYYYITKNKIKLSEVSDVYEFRKILKNLQMEK